VTEDPTSPESRARAGASPGVGAGEGAGDSAGARTGGDSTGTAGGSASLWSHPRVHASLDGLARLEPRRIVSLVPSLSEAIEVLGLGDRLVGVTEYCVHPAGAFERLPKLGGTKDADFEAIAALSPDLVIANQEENTPRVVRKLADRGIDVWVTYPRTVREGAALLADLASLGASDEAIARYLTPVVEAVEAAEARRGMASRATSQSPARSHGSGPAREDSRPRVFCPIWRDPWMTIGPDTYIHDMIELCGGRNLYRDLPAPSGGSAESDRRYPIVDLDEVVAAGPDVILLPDEPYAFDEADARRLSRSATPAARAGRIHLIDGTLVSWYGPRIAEAIRALAAIFANP